jgi:hypothetical protein
MYLDIGHKEATGGWDTWMGCMLGEDKAWKRMVKYNNMDVKITKDLYLELLPWLTNHPALNVIDGKDDACPKCGGNHWQERGYAYTTVGKRKRFQCQNCKGWTQGREIISTDVQYVNAK